MSQVDVLGVGEHRAVERVVPRCRGERLRAHQGCGAAAGQYEDCDEARHEHAVEERQPTVEPFPLGGRGGRVHVSHRHVRTTHHISTQSSARRNLLAPTTIPFLQIAHHDGAAGSARRIRFRFRYHNGWSGVSKWPIRILPKPGWVVLQYSTRKFDGVLRFQVRGARPC